MKKFRKAMQLYQLFNKRKIILNNNTYASKNLFLKLKI